MSHGWRSHMNGSVNSTPAERCTGEVMKNLFGTKMLLMFAYEVASELRVKNKTHNKSFFFFFSQHSSLTASN